MKVGFMAEKQVKLLMVPANGQISIGKAWAGRQIRITESESGDLIITKGTFVPDTEKTFHNPIAKTALKDFNNFESKALPKATDTKALFAKLRKK